MTGIDPDPVPRWAAQQLGIAEDASAAEARRAFLQRLPGDEFVPPPAAQWAVRVRNDRPPPDWSAARTRDGWRAHAEHAALLDSDKQLKDGIEDFAERFWRMPADERRREYESWMARAAHRPISRTRLTQLSQALGDMPMPEADREAAQVVALAEKVRELAVLPPIACIRAQQAWLAEQASALPRWRRAAKTLRDRYPQLAALQSALVKDLARGIRRKAPARPARQPAAARARSERLSAGIVGFPLWVLLLVGSASALFRGALSTPHRTNEWSPPPARPAVVFPYHYDPVKREFLYSDGRRKSLNEATDAERRLFKIDGAGRVGPARKPLEIESRWRDIVSEHRKAVEKLVGPDPPPGSNAPAPPALPVTTPPVRPGDPPDPSRKP